MDNIDKRIILELDYDCRQSYQTIASKIGLTANATKKRITRLLESGLIDRFMTTLAFPMIDAELVLAVVHTDGTEYPEDLIELIGKNPSVMQVSTVACGRGGLYCVFGAAAGSEELLEFGSNLRSFESVLSVEVHVLLFSRGKKIELTRTQKKVLKFLVNNPRMAISEIAESSGMTARRVRKAIDELQEGEGVHFAVFWNLGKGGLTETFIRIEWDEKSSRSDEIVEWLRKEHPLEFWSPFVSATEPVVFARVIVDELEKAESIARAVRRVPFVKSVATLVFYSNKLFDWPGVVELRRMLGDASD
ncbi:MAG: winged helix-turn-helix transcriptional regulator [Candidatus Thorarchaeota archaeon]